MRHLERMLESSETDAFVRRLLNGAAQERPSPQSVTLLRAGLGLQTTALSRIAVLSSWKVALLTISLSALLGLRGTEPASHATLTPAPPAIQAPRAGQVLRANDASGTLAPIAARPEHRPEAAPISAPTSATALDTPRARSGERTRGSPGPDLREEIRLMDAARNAIQSRQAQAALEAIEAYNMRFPAGTFKQEAAVLKIQALALRGETLRANSMAKQFIKNNPDSPYVKRASRIVDHPGGAAPVSP